MAAAAYNISQLQAAAANVRSRPTLMTLKGDQYEVEEKLVQTARDQSSIGPVPAARATTAAPKSRSAFEHGLYINVKRAVGCVVDGVKERALTLMADALYKPILSQPNPLFLDNFGPVEEIGNRVPVEVIEGAIPSDFPQGIYIRNGPNPQFGGGYEMTSPMGKCTMHWFEGDGMLHATYFEKDGKIWYQNKYVETEAFKMEKMRNRPLFLPFLDGDPKAIGMNFFLNWLRFGTPTKCASNTSVYHHAGRVFSVMEGAGLPHEVDVHSHAGLKTVGTQNFKGAWDRLFTPHPKVDPDTKEMIFTGFSPFKPYLVMGVISSDGETILHKADVGLNRPTLCHDIAITPRYTIIFDYPLITDVKLLMKGQQCMAFDHNSYARIGVIPRFGDAHSMKWFNVEMSCTLHIINAFEHGDGIVVLHGLRSKTSLYPFPPYIDKKEWFARAIQPRGKTNGAYKTMALQHDPWIDGALLTCLHEWQFNMITGEVMERDLIDNIDYVEFPTINAKFIGKKYKYAYANVADIDASKKYGLPMFRKQIKMHLPETSIKQDFSQDQTKVFCESRDFGPNRFGSEPQYIAKPGAIDEDDGWLVTYVHDQSTNKSEVHIVSTKKFEESHPIARISLPQRVPYGFHGCFFPIRHD